MIYAIIILFILLGVSLFINFLNWKDIRSGFKISGNLSTKISDLDKTIDSIASKKDYIEYLYKRVSDLYDRVDIIHPEGRKKSNE